MISRKSKILWVAAALAVMAGLIFFISRKRPLDPDELESLYASWLISKGQLPYKDFYQIHTPLAYYLFAPVFFFFNSLTVIGVSRAIVFVLIFLNGFLLFKISRRFFDAKTAIVSLVFYLTSWPVLYKMVEIRPDVFVAIFSNLALMALFWPGRNAMWLFFLGGGCSALAVLSKQSGIIFFVALTALFLWRLIAKNSLFWESDIFSRGRFNVKTFLLFIAGFLSVAAAFLLILRLKNAEDYFFAYSVNNDFLRSALFLRAEAKHWLPVGFIRDSFNFNPGTYLFAFFSLFLFFLKPYSRRAAGAYVFILFLTLACFGALFLVLHPWPQEFILFGQYLSILSAAGLIRMFEGVFSAGLKTSKKLIYSAVLAAAAIFSLCNLFRGIAGEFAIAGPNPVRSFEGVLSSTNENDKCLSIYYPCLFRPSVYFYRIGTNLLESASSRQKVENILIADINRGDIKIVLPSRHLDQMRSLLAIVEGNYIMQGNDFFIPGIAVDLAGNRSENFNILVEGWYQIDRAGGKVLIDGEEKTKNTLYLKKGRHQILCFGCPAKITVSYDLSANKKAR